MSIDINWETLTGGAGGSARAESIREFIHDKFQQVTLPRFIRSVQVHSFDFGSVPPEIEIKDICDPLSDFYEEDGDDVDDGSDDESDDAPAAPPIKELQSKAKPSMESSGAGNMREAEHSKSNTRESKRVSRENPSSPQATTPGPRNLLAVNEALTSPLLHRAHTPGITSTSSNLNYFHLPLSAGLSGTTTPLAAVAGAQIQGWLDNPYARPSTPTNRRLRHAVSANSLTLTPQSNGDPNSRPSSHYQYDEDRKLSAGSDASSQHEYEDTQSTSPHHMREKSPEDIQVVAHVQYSGDIKMSLTAEILLDYPMPSFVGIPLKLNITGLTFDGVAILAYIKRRAHFCFLSPDDADALVGGGGADLSSSQPDLQGGQKAVPRPMIGGLLEHIKVESEIGGKSNGKQVLKNVGKVESFVLEQVRRIFEDEFVYPSFWTFLV